MRKEGHDERIRRCREEAHPKGFIRVELEKDGILKEVGVHRLVCEAFHGVPLQRRRVIHLDADQTNNAAFNLAWGARVRTHKKKPLGASTASERAHCPENK